jgi:hypothetical protein
MLSIVITLLIGAVTIYLAHGQLREARRVREQNLTFVEKQMKEDNLWADKYFRAATILCKIADMDRLPMFGSSGRTVYLGGPLGALFSEDVRKHILGQLIERQNDDTYAPRPIDTSQLRLKATRDLIELVLEKVEKSRTQKPNEAKDLGL